MNFNKKLIIDGGEDDNKSRLAFLNTGDVYFGPKSEKTSGHGAWTDNRLNPLTGRKK